MLSAWQNFTTSDEINFLHKLVAVNPDAARKYAVIVTDGMRRYDRHIEVDRVEAAARRVLETLGA